MIPCPICESPNVPSAKFCAECGAALATIVPDAGGGKPTPEPAWPKEAGGAHTKSVARSSRKDVLFVLDCTGSMQGEIDAVKEAIVEFADYIRDRGTQIRVGLIEFRDRLIGEEHRALDFDGQPFTFDTGRFRDEVAKLEAQGGGDIPESSFDALLLATRQPFEPDARKVLVLITDAPPHVPDREARSVEQVREALKALGLNEFYMMIDRGDASSKIYMSLIPPGLANAQIFALKSANGADAEGQRLRKEHFKKVLGNLSESVSGTK